jgi:hypothetical protein
VHPQLKEIDHCDVPLLRNDADWQVNYVLQMLFRHFVESGVDGFVLLASNSVGELDAEGFPRVGSGLEVEVALGKLYVGVVGSGEDDVIGCGDAALDRQYFAIELLVLD